MTLAFLIITSLMFFAAGYQLSRGDTE